MALALADSIATVGWDLDDQARRYLAWYEKGWYSVNGRCFDIGMTCRSALLRFSRTVDAKTSGDPSEQASGNGSIMRLAPVPIRYGHLYPDRLLDFVFLLTQSSLPTHASPQCLSACAYLGLVLAALMQGIDRKEVLDPNWKGLRDLREVHPFHRDIADVAEGSFRRKKPPEIVGSGYVVKSLEAALWAFHDAKDFREAVLRAVNLGDDADTTGAVCGQLAGAYWGESGIPKEWRDGLARSDMIEGALTGLLSPQTVGQLGRGTIAFFTDQNMLYSALTKIVRPFVDLARAPRAIWYIVLAFVLDSTAYFGILTLMTTYLGRDLGWGDVYAGTTVSLFTMLVTLAMLGVGSVAESFGLRRAILFGLAVAVVGRAIYCLAPDASVAAPWLIIVSLLLVAGSSGILQPVCYSGVKQFTDEKTSSMGYAVIYACMNLGIVLVGALSAWVRPAVQAILDGEQANGHAVGFPGLLARFSHSGVQAVNWLCWGMSVLALLLMAVLLTRRAEATRLRPETTKPLGGEQPLLSWRRIKAYFTDGPFGNARFLFFVFMLLPVQTLFAHQWLTMPQYILRAYPANVGDKMEWLVNWINPGIIFLGVPILTAVTRRANVYTMMVTGSLVSAAPTFLLCVGPNLTMLILYFVLFSIGEALWSARFLEYASELAPPGRVSQYMGLAQIPWLLAKGTTGFYSGILMARYCPADTPVDQLHTSGLWFIYGCIAMTTPIGLWIARKWVISGLHQVHAQSENRAVPAEAAG